MNVILQSDNSQHKLGKMGEKFPLFYTSCGILFAGIGQPCPQKESHKVIFPNCNLHTPPKICEVCFA